MTYTLIQTQTIGATSVASIDFTGISGSFTDLVLVLNARTDRASVTSDIYFQFNGVTTATYSFRRLYGTGNSGAGSDSLTNQSNGGFIGLATGASATASTFGNTAVTITNYAGSTAKSWSGDGVNETNAAGAFQEIVAGLWSGTNAITSISIKDYNGANFVQYSTASLYGIN